MNACPVCQSGNITNTIRINDVPVYCNVLWPTAAQALQAARGDMDLCFCGDCGHVYNRAFNQELMNYNEDYENSLHFSALFNDYANALADRLIKTYNIRERDIIEIGCGKGDFLAMLCDKGSNRGYGFDRSVEQDRESIRNADGITFINDFYNEKYADRRADLIVCRHVLEHIQEPLEFLGHIRATLADQPDTVLYFEVPNVLYTLKDMGIWDLIYEHCAYFSPASLHSAFLESGFEILASGESFGGQFLYIEARPHQSGNTVADNRYTHTLPELAGYVDAFRDNYHDKIGNWNKVISKSAKSGNKAVIWGGGSKGVTFLNTVQSQGNIDYVVDLNPHKHGLFVPGTGQQVVAPEFLRKYSPAIVFIMNSIYHDEIAVSLNEMGISAEIYCV